MKANINGIVSGIQSGDAITAIEVVWKQGGETEDAAIAAGRIVTLVSAIDIAAYQAGGYALTSAALVSGSTYVPAVRVTESRSGAGSYVGAWTNGAEFAAQDNVWLVSFAGSAFSSRLTKYSAGSGTIADGVDGELISVPAGVGHAAGFVVNDPLVKPASGTKTLRVRASNGGGSTSSLNICLWQAATRPALPGTVAALDLSRRRAFFGFSTAATPNGSPAYMVNSAGATNILAHANPASAQGLDQIYDFTFTMTPTQVRMQIATLAGVTQLDTGLQAIGSTMKDDGNPFWLEVGYGWTDQNNAVDISCRIFEIERNW